MIKLIAIDLDGTLLRDDKTISEANIQSIQQAIHAGVEVVICTGRPIEGIQFVLDQCQMNSSDHYSITYNGGLVLRNQSREVISETIMKRENLEKIEAVMQELDLPVDAVGIDAAYRMHYPKDWPGTYDQLTTYMPFYSYQSDDLQEDYHFYKIVVNTEEEHLQSQIKNLPAWLSQTYSVMQSHPYQLEVMPKGIDKGTGLEALSQYLGIQAAEVMAIGDEQNDLAMLEWAGTGVAMANASDEVKAHATYVTKSNGEDGVAHAIHRFILDKKEK